MKLDDGTMAIIRETARETAREVMVQYETIFTSITERTVDQHAKDCSVRQLERIVNGTPSSDGLKTMVARLNEHRGFWRQVVVNTLPGLIVAFVLGLLMLFKKL